MIGALTHFIAEAPSEKFQPMPPNFGLLPELPERIRDKRRRYGAYRDRALAAIAELGNELGGQLPVQPSTPLLALA
jgi:methylenetetrahydrofolate--tRNA-(uracil-5-)-methyltransferase